MRSATSLNLPYDVRQELTQFEVGSEKNWAQTQSGKGQTGERKRGGREGGGGGDGREGRGERRRKRGEGRRGKGEERQERKRKDRGQGERAQRGEKERKAGEENRSSLLLPYCPSLSFPGQKVFFYSRRNTGRG